MYEIHTLDDGTMVKAVPSNGCKGCIGNSDIYLCSKLPKCTPSKRKDKQEAIFKRHIRLAVEVKE